MKKNVTIVTGADTKYFRQLKGLVLSIRQAKEIAGLPIAVLDAGLTAEDRLWLAGLNVSIIRPNWNFEFLAASRLPEYFKVMTCRPFLPKYLPNTQIYVWMDADTWVQDEQAVLWAIECASAQGSAITVVPEINRCYRNMYRPPKEAHSEEMAVYRACFGEETANQLGPLPLINAGFFALAKDSDTWMLWAEILRRMYLKSLSFYTEQCSLNYCIYSLNVPMVALPSHCNWICYHALPIFNVERKTLTEPAPPYQDLWIVHMTTSAGKFSYEKEGASTQSLEYPGLST